MIKEYVDAWFRNRDKLKKYFETHMSDENTGGNKP